ncbi:MAG: VPLPA-CTERM sorting domain-containing protein [Pseudomonadota bacterium]
MNKYAYAILLVASFLLTGNAQSAQFQLDLTADGDSRFIDHFSASYAEITRPWNGSQEIDGFFCIDGTMCPPGIGTDGEIGSGRDIFPNETAFTNAGLLDYDMSGVSGSGIESASITGLSLDFFQHVLAENILNADYVTNVNSFSGTVDLFNGQVSSIDLTADITNVFDSAGFGMVPFQGTFTITDNLFAFLVDETVASPAGPFRQEWDITGSVDNLAAIPLPAGIFLLAPGLLGLVAISRRQQRLSIS